MSRAWMPWYVGDYLRDTAHLTTLEHGAYLLLIAHYWERGPLPDDDNQLATITRMHVEKWRRIRPKLVRFFDVWLETQPSSEASAEQLVSKCWFHKRIDAELQKAEIISIKRKIAGRNGGMRANGHTNMQRYINGAIGKQTGNQSPSKKERGPPKEDDELTVSPSLSRTIKEKGWTA
jgi:uncharacterized protein YdaU (DUF1376 family)